MTSPPDAPRRTILLVLFGCLAACGGGGGTPQPPLDPIVPELAAGPPPLLTLALVGDTHTFAIDAAPPATSPLADVAYLIQPCDVFLFNHEGVLHARGAPPDGCPSWPNQTTLSAPVPTADIYTLAPLNVATLGNNHILDCGIDGLTRTQDAFTTRGILHTGAGPDATAACTPLRSTVNGVPVAVVSYLEINVPDLHAGSTTPGAAGWSACAGAAQVAALKAGGDFVIACLHLHIGASWVEHTWETHLAVVNEALDAGADIVVVHGPHVPQGLLTRPGQVAFLSLGNFLFRPPQVMPEPAHRCVVARVALYADRVDVTLVPFRIDAFGIPHLPTASDAKRILDGVTRQASIHGTALERRGHAAYLSVAR